MAFEKDTIVEEAIAMGFSHAHLAKVEPLKPLNEVRDMCASGKCQIYGKCWTCPPACGTIEECSERMHKYDWGILLQTTAELEDSMDYEGMMEGEQKQKENCFKFAEMLSERYEHILPLSSGGCRLCKQCTYPDAPCRFPKKALSSMEAYGLLVSDVCKDNDLPYYYGRDTVTYTALFLIKDN